MANILTLVAGSAQIAPPAPAEPQSTSPVMALLRAGVPLTLLFDLATGPRSAAIYRDESGDLEWIRRIA